MLTVINAFIYCLFAILVIGSLLPLSSSPHWFIRNWDYPRVQMVALSVLAMLLYVVCNGIAGRVDGSAVRTLSLVTVAIAGWHLFRILPYTPLMPPQAETWQPSASTQEEPQSEQSPLRLRILISNVEMENDQFSRWTDVMLATDADIVIVAEVDDRWAATLEKLKAEYPHQIVYPQDNWYGMAMLSRLPIVSHRIRFLVQDDIPSIDSIVRLPSGDEVRVVGVHPRPPEPIRDNDATARDAELVLWGKELAEDNSPIVIGGDLNDVAWSQSTRLFLRLSGLLDPRRGRGFFNSFHAEHVWMRFPLDHVFHSTHFMIRDLQRLPPVGSDHFPIFIDLQLTPVAVPDQAPLETTTEDEEEAEIRLDRAEEKHGLDVDSIDEADRQPTKKSSVSADFTRAR